MSAVSVILHVQHDKVYAAQMLFLFVQPKKKPNQSQFPITINSMSSLLLFEYSIRHSAFWISDAHIRPGVQHCLSAYSSFLFWVLFAQAIIVANTCRTRSDPSVCQCRMDEWCFEHGEQIACVISQPKARKDAFWRRILFKFISFLSFIPRFLLSSFTEMSISECFYDGY